LLNFTFFAPKFETLKAVINPFPSLKNSISTGNSILPVSTGNDKKYVNRGKQQTANTPRGDYKITRQIAGVRHAPLGDLYYPNYFLGGWAIHGSTSIPFLPASHGCVRIPNFAAEDFSHLVRVDMNVFVYD